jgi:hypothetical protein
MACEHWLASDARMILGLRAEEAMRHHVVIDVKDEAAIFTFLDSDSASGLWYTAYGMAYAAGCPNDAVRFMFADPATAFDFKLRFG